MLTEPKNVVTCENLVKIYKVVDLEVVALQGLDLTVKKGEMLGIVGTSGSGKTTLMNILGGLDRPSAGKVMVDGLDLLNLSQEAINKYQREKVGFVWQQTSRNLIPYLSAYDNIELPMVLAGVPVRQARQRVGALLEAVDLVDRQHHYLAQLSGGEQQRVAIAVALANQPSLILADEPTGELDTNTAQTIYSAFKGLNQQFGVTTLIVTHDQAIARHVQRVVAIRDGKTATETVRVEAPQAGDASKGVATPTPGEELYEELVVLDSAGRLQIPKEYLERLHIKGRARLELVEDGILLRSAPASALEQAAKAIATEQAGLPGRSGTRWLPKGLRLMLERWRESRQESEEE